MANTTTNTATPLTAREHGLLERFFSDMGIAADPMTCEAVEPEAEVVEITAEPSRVFASGLSRPGNARPFIRAGAPIGVVAGELSARMRDVVRNYTGAGGEAFVDSGAFTVYTRGGEIDFDAILDTYDELAGDNAQPWNLHVVAPDVLGDQGATLELLAKYRDRLSALAVRGVRILVPMQGGELKGADLFRAIDAALDGIVGWIPAVPFNRCAWDLDDVLAFVAEVEPEELHLLGGGVKKTAEAADAIARIAATEVQGDANRARAWVGKGRPLEGEIATRRDELDELAQAADLEIDEKRLARAAKDEAIAERVRAETGRPELEATWATAAAGIPVSAIRDAQTVEVDEDELEALPLGIVEDDDAQAEPELEPRRWVARGPLRSTFGDDLDVWKATDGTWVAYDRGREIGAGLATRKAAKALVEKYLEAGRRRAGDDLPDAPLVVAYGMGVDSTAMLVGLHERGIRPDAILFADVGAEKPETYAYLETVSAWLESVGFPPVTVVRYNARQSSYSDLEGNCLTNETLPSLAYGGHSCSIKWKADAQTAHLKTWAPAQRAISAGRKIRKAIGYDCSPADVRRYKKASKLSHELEAAEYPLVEWGWTRVECEAAIKRAGLPVPVKSACFFCPASKEHEIRDLEARHPELLLRALVLEETALTSEKHAGARSSTVGLGRRFAWRDVVDSFLV